MKQFRKILCLLLLFSLVLPTFGEKSASASSTGWKVTVDVLNVREKAGTKYKILGKLKKNQSVHVISTKNGWSKITYGKTSGWVSSEFLTYKSWTGYVKSKALNVRKTASTSATVVVKVPHATSLKIEEQKGNWYKVYDSSKKKRGWVMSKYVTNKVVKTNVQPKVIGELYVNANSLNIRSGPGTTNDILFKLKKNTKVELYEVQGNWGKVSASSSQIGWASLTYLSSEPVTEETSPTEEQPTEEGQPTTIVLTDDSNIRTGPGTKFDKIVIEKAGTRLTALGEENGWVQVQTKDGTIGWVAGWLTVPLGTTGPLKGKLIVIDAGHGGKDPGAVGKRTNEKTLNIQTTLELTAILQKAGAAVVLTRSDDIFLTLAERVTISNKLKPDAYLSVHYNAGTATSSGIMTFYYNNTKDSALAKAVHKGLITETKMKDQGVRFGNFQVIRDNKYPSILLELGFISNPDEEKVILTKSYQEKAALGVYNGLLDYFKVSSK